MSFECAIEHYPDMFNKKLKVSTPEVLDLNIKGPSSLSIRDSVLIVSSNNAEGFLYFFKSDDLAFLGNYIPLGRANNELLSSPRVFKQYFYDKSEESHVAIYEFETGKILDLNITETLNNKCIVASKYDAGLPKSLFSVMKLDDDSFFCREVDNTHSRLDRFIFRNSERSCSKYMAQLNAATVKSGADVNNLNAYYAYNREKKVIAEALMDLRHINVYSLENGSPHMTLMAEKNLDKLENINKTSREKRVVAYNHIASYDDFFVALYQGDTRENIELGKAKNQFLHFFSWQGIPLIEVELDRRINSFDIDFKNGFMYTVN